MDSSLIIIVLLLLLAASIAVTVLIMLRKRRLAMRIRTLRDEMVAVSGDASVGRRLNIGDYPDTADLARTINQLFDALGERDQKIQGRDRLFRDFSRTLPEIVLIHDDKFLLANESAAALIGLEPP